MPLIWRDENPLSLDPAFYKDLEDLIGPSPFHFVVTHGYRSPEKQRELYRQKQLGIIKGKVATPGNSPHEYGLAVDVVLDTDPAKPGLQPSWDLKLAGWVWLIAKLKLHPRLKSGISFDDANHIERYKWRNYIPK